MRTLLISVAVGMIAFWAVRLAFNSVPDKGQRLFIQAEDLRMLFHQPPTEAEEAEVFGLLTEAARLGNAPAMCNLAYYYRNGRIVQKDLGKAIELLKKSAAKGHDLALLAHGNFLKAEPGSVDEGLQLLNKALTSRDQYVRGRAAEFLAVHYWACVTKERADAESARQAFEFATRAVDEQNSYGYFLTGKLILSQIGTSQPQHNAYAMFQRGVDRNNDDCKVQLAHGYIEASEASRLTRDLDKARSLLALVSQRSESYKEAQVELSRIFQLQNMPKLAFEAAESAQRLGSPEGALRVYGFKLVGYGTNTDETGAYQGLVNLARTTNASEAIRLVGICHYQGAGTSKNLDEALKQFKASADKGNGRAAVNVANMLAKGEGCTQDLQEAMQWGWKGQRNGGDEEAAIFLAGRYLEGDAVPRDINKAVELLQRGCRQGDHTSLLYMSEAKYMAEEYEEALTLAIQAAKTGSQVSRERFKELLTQIDYPAEFLEQQSAKLPLLKEIQQEVLSDEAPAAVLE